MTPGRLCSGKPPPAVISKAAGIARLTRAARALALAMGLLATALPATAAPLSQSPMLDEKVVRGELPPVAERVPDPPRVVRGESLGRYGGSLRLAMAQSRDTRMMAVYGYARLVGYNRDFELVPDILESFEVEDSRVFTLTLRAGHRWSDGHPFTTEDFRYWWEDVANNEHLSPFGPPPFMLADGKPPKVEFLDERRVRYSWSEPNPFFLAALAGARPAFIYAPAHYLKQFHPAWTDPAKIEALVNRKGMRNWPALHNSLDNLYDMDNPELPTLQPWMNTVRPPAQQFVFVRNPFFHRVDPEGRQLPYIDRVLLNISDSKLIPAKAGAGEVDLQARSLFMSHYPFLKQTDREEGFRVLLWETAQGSDLALYPNLHVNDPAWRALFREADFRRALSLAIDRFEINEVIYYGLGAPSNNTVLPASPLFREEYRTRWAVHDPERANALLDGLGLDRRDGDGVRLLPDGRRLEIVVETAGEETVQTDVLELIRDHWLEIGVKIFTRPSQRTVFRNRIFAGATMMSIAPGVSNALVTADMSPEEFVPTAQDQYQWPKWGQYEQTGGQAGEPIDLPAAEALYALFERWQRAETTEERRKIWHRILEINANQVFSIGIVCCTKQPVVVSDRLKNVPKEGIYAWDPGAHFGIYLPDTFYFAEPEGAGK